MYKRRTETFVAREGNSPFNVGKKTALTMKMLCQLGKGLQMQQFLPLKKKGDCRKLFKSSGNYALTVSHKLDTKNASVKLPSGSK